MVRLDKIIYMITCFKSLASDLEQSQYSLPKEDIVIDEDILRVMSRIGVIPKSSDGIQITKELLNSIPFGRELFLLSNTEKHSNELCLITNPNCDLCNMNKQCDYNNKKNIWADRENSI